MTLLLLMTENCLTTQDALANGNHAVQVVSPRFQAWNLIGQSWNAPIQSAFGHSSYDITNHSLLVLQKLGRYFSKLPLKAPEEEKEVNTSLPAANEITVDAAVAIV